MRHLRLLVVIAVALSASVWWSSAGRRPAAQASPDSRPNVLIFMTDDQRASADEMSALDGIRRIYGDAGTYFPNAVVTTPLCCPSRASLFTGRFAHNTMVVENKVPPSFDQTTTLQYQLQRLGYHTAIVGKYLNGFVGPPPYFDLHDVFAGYTYDDGTYATVHLWQRVVEYLNTFEQTDDTPWLMYVTPFAPHPQAVPETKYAQAPVPPWEDTPSRTETDLSDKPALIQKQSGQVTLDDIKQLRERMIRTLYSVDDAAEQIFAQLDALGEDNTIAFFLSDNGYLWYEHGLEAKGVPYDEAVNVPFFVRWPGHVAAGATDTRVVANIDIAPTIYDILGQLPTNYVLDGQSLFRSSRTSILTEGISRGYRSLWSPGEVYTEWNDGFREYYGADDPWELDNAFVVGTPPTNAQALHDELARYLPPTITGFAPTSGAPGSLVTITGSNLSGLSSVLFAGMPAPIVDNGTSSVTATVPDGAAGGPISVSKLGGEATSSGSFTVTTSEPGVAITSFSPTSGAAGTQVIIDGSGFGSTTGVAFGATSASFTVISETQLAATVPSTASSGPVTVTTTGGSATSSASFTVAAPVKTVNVTVGDDFYRPKAVTMVPGGVVVWTFTGSHPHAVRDAALLGAGSTPLFDSGSRTSGSFSSTFRAAGTYAYVSAQGEATVMKGTVAVPVTVSPSAGTSSTTFTVTVTSAPVAGFASVVQSRFQPPGGKWGSWKTIATTTTSGLDFTPVSGAGAYQFRSRLRNVDTGRMSSQSPVAKVMVS
jgi:arylsulfatase A-like enzyme/plastocyanin